MDLLINQMEGENVESTDRRGQSKFSGGFQEKHLDDHFPSIVVEEVANGDEALQKINAASPGLIFVDIRLPGANGLHLTKEIKKNFPGIGIAILTDFDLPEYREAAKQYGADRFFVKSSFKWDEVERW